MSISSKLKVSYKSIQLKHPIALFCAWIILSLSSFSQENSKLCSDSCKSRKLISIGLTSVAYTGGMAALYQLWYADYPTSSFHFFNDNDEWLQMDKVGHSYSAFHLAETGYLAAKYSCFNESQSIWIGGGAGLLFLTTVEIFDGFSDGWGASWGDVGANTMGYLLFSTQQHFWNEQRIRMKFSYFPSKYAQYRPDLLGNSFGSRMFKDYNAQTYWLSVSPASFFEGKNKWPEWLAISLGYSGDGMTGGSNNPEYVDGKPIPSFTRQRQYYLSLDLNLAAIHTRSKVLNTVLHAVNLVKTPFPAASLNKTDGFKFHALYF